MILRGGACSVRRGVAWQGFLMNEDKKIAVYLCALDWVAVKLCLESHIARGTCDGKPIWNIGADRAKYIIRRIDKRLPAKTTGEQE